MNIKWTREAKDFFQEQIDYIKEKNPIAGKRVSERVHRTIISLKTNPHLGTEHDKKGTRKILDQKYQNLIFYKLDTENQIIKIVAVINTRMNTSLIVKRFL